MQTDALTFQVQEAAFAQNLVLFYGNICVD